MSTIVARVLDITQNNRIHKPDERKTNKTMKKHDKKNRREEENNKHN